MKIAYCIAATHNSGGMERVLANKVNYLVKKGYEVVIITTDQQYRAPYFALDSNLVQIDLSINYSDNEDKGLLQKIMSYASKQRIHKKRLTTCLAELKADVVVSMFDHEASFLHRISDGSKKVLEIHFSRYKRLQYGRTGIWGLIDRYRNKQDLAITKRYDRFVVLTKEDQSYWGDLKNIQVIPNANSFVPKGVADLTQKRVIAVGRYDYQKRFEDLIQAWKIVHQQQPDWELAIYGNGPLGFELENLVHELDLTKTITLALPVQNIEQEYRNSSILAMTSRYEGLPMTLLEAQSCGLPLVSYACKCGPKDLIENGVNGFLLKEGDIQGFAEQLLVVMSDEALRKQIGAASILKSADFTEDKIMKQWIDLFTTLLNKSA